jgi:hypothetical protein
MVEVWARLGPRHLKSYLRPTLEWLRIGYKCSIGCMIARLRHSRFSLGPYLEHSWVSPGPSLGCLTLGLRHPRFELRLMLGLVYWGLVQDRGWVFQRMVQVQVWGIEGFWLSIHN